jgi:hypothetical protein
MPSIFASIRCLTSIPHSNTLRVYPAYPAYPAYIHISRTQASIPLHRYLAYALLTYIHLVSQADLFDEAGDRQEGGEDNNEDDDEDDEDEDDEDEEGEEEDPGGFDDDDNLEEDDTEADSKANSPAKVSGSIEHRLKSVHTSPLASHPLILHPCAYPAHSYLAHTCTYIPHPYIYPAHIASIPHPHFYPVPLHVTRTVASFSHCSIVPALSHLSLPHIHLCVSFAAVAAR